MKGEKTSYSRSRLSFGQMPLSVIAGMTMLIVVAAVACSGFMWTAKEADNQQQLKEQELIASADMLAAVAKKMVRQEELDTLRYMVARTAKHFGYKTCRVSLPDGGVIADADTSLITAGLDLIHNQTEDDLKAAASLTDSIAKSENELLITRVVQINDDVRVLLTLGRDDLKAESVWQVQTGDALITVLAILLLLALYNRLYARFNGMSRVRNALLHMFDGEECLGAARINERFGDEAVAWNGLLKELTLLRDLASANLTADAMGASTVGSGELTAGCDALSQGIVLIDHQANIQYCNHAGALFLGTKYDESLGKHVLDMIHHDELNAVLQAACTGQAKRRTLIELNLNELSGIEPDQETTTPTNLGVLRFTVYPLNQSGMPSTMIVIDDVTQQRVAEESRHEFVAQATHELRTPLTNIRLYLETMIDDGEDDELRENCLNIINQETARLERMVTDMLSVAEIEAGAMRLKFDDVRIEDEVNAIERDYAAQASEKRISLIIEMPPKLPVIQADREKVVGSLHNLVGNAIKYTPDGGRVNLIVEQTDHEIAIEVRDTGLGISEQDQQRVFEKFYRSSDRRIKGIKGSGLGLSIAREMVRLHGGDITVDSTIDHGSTFKMTLPMNVAIAA